VLFAIDAILNMSWSDFRQEMLHVSLGFLFNFSVTSLLLTTAAYDCTIMVMKLWSLLCISAVAFSKFRLGLNSVSS